uniref:Uncharacterized protein n=1 Tax=Glossina pallidipes TaxID=7398 RepID=A0A1A9ZRI7_GLOPL
MSSLNGSPGYTSSSSSESASLSEVSFSTGSSASKLTGVWSSLGLLLALLPELFASMALRTIEGRFLLGRDSRSRSSNSLRKSRLRSSSAVP